MQDRFVQTFLQEARELLEELEATLLDLEKSPDDPELVCRAFRAMHTIKGSSSMFGFEGISSLTHELESLFDLVRNGKLEVSKKIIDLSLEAYDLLSVNIQNIAAGEASDFEQAGAIIQALRGIVSEKGEELSSSQDRQPISCPDVPVGPEADSGLKIYYIRFSPPSNMFVRGMDPMHMIDELNKLGDCNVTICTDMIPELDEIDPESCYAAWGILVVSTSGPEALWDVFAFLLDDAGVSIDKIYDSSSNIAPDYRKLGGILVRKGILDAEDLKEILNDKKRLGECLLESGLIRENQLKLVFLEPNEIKRTVSVHEGEKTAPSIRVLTEKLDSLVDLVGEMVTLQAAFRQSTSKWDDISLMADESDTIGLTVGEISSINTLSSKMELLVAELRDNAMSLRMVPIGVTFEKFRRLVRDLSSELGKEVEFRTFGGETEMDKTVIEQLNDPIVHVIRNCMDHGIELPETREASGKPRQGVISISAEHQGATVRIDIRDDGGGLDNEAIRQTAIAKGLILPEEEPSDETLYSMLFAVGFSTSTNVTSISGRGVGMDVLRKNIESLRGTIRLASRPGEGTCVSITLPLTLAIIDCLLVNIGMNKFLLPLLSVEECVELGDREISEAHGKRLLKVRGDAVPYIDLRDTFAIKGDKPELRQVVITGSNGSRIGFAVDSVIGEHQTVIKPLGAFYKKVYCVSGATVLGDGSVALIVDTKNILASAAETCS